MAEKLFIKGQGERLIRGVAAVISSQDGKILAVQETEDKPLLDKKRGDWSIPAETVEAGETELEALSRLIREEVGENGDITWDPKQDLIGDYQFGAQTPIWGRAYILHFGGTSEARRTFVAERTEVINHRWIHPDEIRDMPRRKAVLEVVEDFVAGRRGVVRKECTPGFRPNR